MNVKHLRLIAALAAIVALAFSAPPSVGEAQVGGRLPLVPDAYFVVFNDGVASPADAANDIAKSHGLSIRHVFSFNASAFSAIVPPGRVKGLSNDPRVASVSPVPVAFLFGEQTATGIDRIDAEVTASATAGNGVDVVVLDSGSGPHPDLSVTRIDATGDGGSPDDFVGHGTHVAGTIAAAFGNNLDVFGVSPGVNLFGVRVFRPSGGPLDDVLNGLKWVEQRNVTNLVEVVNMSLGIFCVDVFGNPAPELCPDLADHADDDGILGQITTPSRSSATLEQTSTSPGPE